jgi:hypothetical protein
LPGRSAEFGSWQCGHFQVCERACGAVSRDVRKTVTERPHFWHFKATVTGALAGSTDGSELLAFSGE